MMINRRLIAMVPEAKKPIAANVAAQWISLVANVAAMGALASFIASLPTQGFDPRRFALAAAVLLAAAAVRYLCAGFSARMAYKSSAAVKRTVRQAIYEKLLALGPGYGQAVKTSEVVQVAVEGADQLETYFAAYLPQLFYSLAAPITLFGVLCAVNVPSALVLLVCVPLIPVAIAAVQTWAKKLLGAYWDQYAQLGDSFLENLQGLTTLKIYEADESKQQQMAREAEQFRRITMRVLTMQLNSITIMDLIAYGGAAAGIGVALSQVAAGTLDFGGCLFVILIAADFFIPMRLLGSFFHIAMNGMAASDKIFKLLDAPEPPRGTASMPRRPELAFEQVFFGYDPRREVLASVSGAILPGQMIGVVGESGSGKSTLAHLLMGQIQPTAGRLAASGTDLAAVDPAQIAQRITYVGHQAHLFAGTVRENLLLAKPRATDEELWQAVGQVRLAEFLRSESGLDTPVAEKASNLSGGQRQRLALARALLHDSDVYIFDEATSNIDVESESAILEAIHQLARIHTVVLVSHRLANVAEADAIWVMDHGRLTQQGTHQELVATPGLYQQLWKTQRSLETFGQGGVAA